MAQYDTNFIMELFLDDTVSTVNRLVVATTNVINENLENIAYFNEFMIKEFVEHTPSEKPAKRLNHEYYMFYEKVVRYFTDADYMKYFKMRKSTVRALITFLGEYAKPDDSIISFDKKIHVFLWLLTNDFSFNDVGEKFGLKKSSVIILINEIATLLSEQRYQFINWPSIEEQNVTRVKINALYGFPNCVGFLDACRIKTGPKNKTETVLLQAVCDESLMFLDVFVGETGITRKSQIFRESMLAKELKNFIHPDNHVLGDAQYKLKRNLIIPFSTDEVLTGEERRFNRIHSKAYNYIEQAFKIFKRRFKKMNHIDMSKPEDINTLIHAACVLHNFILLHEGPPMEEAPVLNNESITIDTNVVTSAIGKRQFLSSYINYMQTS